MPRRRHATTTSAAAAAAACPAMHHRRQVVPLVQHRLVVPDDVPARVVRPAREGREHQKVHGQQVAEGHHAGHGALVHQLANRVHGLVSHAHLLTLGLALLPLGRAGGWREWFEKVATLP